jgi:hypothetical protein
MLKATKSRFYVVPVLMCALDILELLSRSGVPLKTNEISRMTGVSPTTTYRILRTLIHRGYLVQDLDGRFGLLNRPEMSLPSGQDANTEPITDLSGDQVIEILHSVLQTLRQRNEASLDHDINRVHSNQRQRIRTPE